MTSETCISLEKFVKQQEELLALERASEVSRAQELVQAHSHDARELERRGVALRRMVVSEQRTGLYGRTIVTYGKEKSLPLPATNISNGDIVGVFATVSAASETEESSPSGVVTQVTANSISVSFDESIESLGLNDDNPVNIIKLANDVTYKRLKRAIDLITRESNFSTLHHGLFATTELGPPLQDLHPAILNEDKEIRFRNTNLNSCQKEAVKFSLLQRELAIVHGPPGTGKTTTIVEIISQEVLQGRRVLCCAPSNVAVDNLLEKLVRNKIRVLRLGHPARLNQELLGHSLDAVLSNSDQTQLVQDVRGEVDKALVGLRRARGDGERRRLRNELRDLRKELREREKKAMKEILQRADVVLSTLTSASGDGPLKHLQNNDGFSFDVTVIDECSQSLEMACWIALLHSKKAILAGDHFQLPPTILSPEAAAKGLSLTLMERAIKLLGKSVVRMLTTQYRMNKAIMNWSSKEFYHSELEADESVASHLLKDLPGVSSNENTDIPLLLIDTSGCDLYEVESSDDISRANEGEVSLVVIHTEELIKSGVNPSEIAIITPYNLQVDLIRLQLSSKYPTLEVRSVDGFQGREKEAVVISLVRSNNKGEIGFLSEHRRLNVAVTRAKRHVAVICDVDTISTDPVLKRFTEYLNSLGEVRSASQYQHLIENQDIIRPDGLEFVLNDSKKEVKASSASKVNKTEKRAKTVQSKPDNNKSTISNEVKNVEKPKEVVEEQEAADAKKRNELSEMVSSFVQSEENVYRFPPNLTSYERMLVHEIAEEHGLVHESQGDGGKRCLVLMKERVQSQEVNSTKAGITKVSSQGSVGTKAKGGGPVADVVVCNSCLREVPRSNIDLHKIRCEKSKVQVSVEPSKKSKKKPSSDGAGRVGDKLEDEDDIDKLLDSFTKMNTVCNDDNCKTKVSVLGVNCNFCARRYCLNHGLPEAHGCGDAARSAARQQLSRDGKLYPGSGRPDKKPDPIRKAQLQRKLDKKLNELGDERKSKPKKK